jgi:hypothetical protein
MSAVLMGIIESTPFRMKRSGAAPSLARNAAQERE